MTADFKDMIQQTERELIQRVHERDELDKRIAQLNLALRGLANMLPEPQKQQLLFRISVLRRTPSGLTDSIRQALSDAPDGMTGAEIKARLENSGFDLSDYSQPISAIHVALRRMRFRGEVRIAEERNGLMVFKLGRAIKEKRQSPQHDAFMGR